MHTITNSSDFSDSADETINEVLQDLGEKTQEAEKESESIEDPPNTSTAPEAKSQEEIPEPAKSSEETPIEEMQADEAPKETNEAVEKGVEAEDPKGAELEVSESSLATQVQKTAENITKMPLHVAGSSLVKLEDFSKGLLTMQSGLENIIQVFFLLRISSILYP